MQLKYVLSTLTLAAVCAATSFAATTTYSATLSGANEVPKPTGSTATGFETLSLTGDLLTIDVNFTGLSAPATAAHIHCCAPIGTNAPVELGYAMFPNATSGTYSETVDLSTFSFGTGITETTFLAGLNSGQAYANIHDANFPAGEIRGQFAPTPTPEPGSLLLVATGLMGAVGVVRRKLRA